MNPVRMSGIEGRVPRPFPDKENPGHYMNVFHTPVCSAEGEIRSPDDWQPRANIKKLYSQGKLNSEPAIQDFSNTFMVDIKLVDKYIKHLKELECRKKITSVQRKRDNTEKEKKTYNDYDWFQLVLTGKLSKLKVFELDKYLDEHNIEKRKKTKSQKINIIVSNIKIEEAGQLASTTVTGSELINQESADSLSDTDSEVESDFEVVRVTMDYENDTDSSDDDEETPHDAPERVSVTTRSGRSAKAFRF